MCTGNHINTKWQRGWTWNSVSILRNEFYNYAELSLFYVFFFSKVEKSRFVAKKIQFVTFWRVLYIYYILIRRWHYCTRKQYSTHFSISRSPYKSPRDPNAWLLMDRKLYCYLIPWIMQQGCIWEGATIYI